LPEKLCLDIIEARTKTKEEYRYALSLVIYNIVAYFRGFWLVSNKFSKRDTLFYHYCRNEANSPYFHKEYNTAIKILAEIWTNGQTLF